MTSSNVASTIAGFATISTSISAKAASLTVEVALTVTLPVFVASAFNVAPSKVAASPVSEYVTFSSPLLSCAKNVYE